MWQCESYFKKFENHCTRVFFLVCVFFKYNKAANKGTDTNYRAWPPLAPSWYCHSSVRSKGPVACTDSGANSEGVSRKLSRHLWHQLNVLAMALLLFKRAGVIKKKAQEMSGGKADANQAIGLFLSHIPDGQLELIEIPQESLAEEPGLTSRHAREAPSLALSSVFVPQQHKQRF